MVGTSTAGALELLVDPGVGPVPVEPGSECARAREILDVPLAVDGASQQLPEQLPVVALDQFLRRSREQEEELVPRLLPLLDRRHPEGVRVADRQDDEPLHPLRDIRGERPGETGAPVVSDDVGSFDAESVEDGDHVGHASRDRVVLDRLRLVRLAEATQVRCDDALAVRDECRDLVTPQPGRVGKPVQEEHGGAFALVAHGERDAVTLDSPQLVPLRVMLPRFWVASTKPERALRRAKAEKPSRGGGCALAPRDRGPEAGVYCLEGH
jgi:hypothetical protein